MSTIIEEFLSGLEKSQTKRIYKQHINAFFSFIKDEHDLEPDEYMKNTENVDLDVLKFWATLRKYAPMTRASRISTVKIFLEENEIKLKRKTWNRIKRQKKSIARTKDHVPTPSELKSILQHARLKEKSLFLMMASSGLRISEALNLTPEDIVLYDMNGKLDSPAKINIRQDVSKNDTPRIAFMSDEARDALVSWLKVRDEWLRSNVKRYNHTAMKINPDDKRIFPISQPTAWFLWTKLLDKSGLNKKDPSTKRFEIHIHTLRKYFINRCKGVIREDVVEKLSGHEGYLSSAYSHIPENELRDEYLKAMPSVSIFEVPPDLAEINESIIEKEDRIKELEETMHIMKMKMDIIENKYELEKIKNGKD